MGDCSECWSARQPCQTGSCLMKNDDARGIRGSRGDEAASRVFPENRSYHNICGETPVGVRRRSSPLVLNLDSHFSVSSQKYFLKCRLQTQPTLQTPILGHVCCTATLKDGGLLMARDESSLLWALIGKQAYKLRRIAHGIEGRSLA